MEREEINSLIEKYIRGLATEEERMRLLNWYRKSADKEAHWVLADQAEEEDLKNRLFQQISIHTQPPAAAPKRSYLSKKQWYQIAAALFVVLGSSLWLLSREQPKPQSRAQIAQSTPILPGRHTATLTLTDGTTVNLDHTAKGQVAQQSGVMISKTDNGELEYTIQQAEGVSPEIATNYNTISTPNGGRYQINLPDGTKVWLNAASSLKFPTIFKGNERKVELAGEGYFEVATNAKKPFKVLTRTPQGTTQEIEVLGTHFNADSYGDVDQAIKTTLMEGRVRISTTGNNKQIILKPGEQSTLHSGSLAVAQVDLEEVMAWKNGYFVFNDEDIRLVMAKISRWYDVEVVFPGEIKDLKIGGSISQSRNLEEVLDLLSLTKKVKFKVAGRRIIVTQ